MRAIVNLLMLVIVILIINDLLGRHKLNKLQQEQTRLNISVLQMEMQILMNQDEQEER